MTPAATSLKPGVVKDPAIAALFSNKDPESRYDDLKEIGHGSFGAVYFAFDKDRGETVAVKKMNFSGKQASEKWTDIVKEVTFLSKIRHPHIIEYKACFLKEQTCWLVMEYCIGSAADIVDVLRKGLREVEIAEIVAQTLEAIIYLHSMRRIHRDLKAGNILLSDSAIIKLADFGSASLTDPAQTFIGTPFFMAPEVILAMDEGHYSDRADIWSLGITCIELAERRPPLFSMNAMSALYHIAQNDPPILAPTPPDQSPWSQNFTSFIDKCLRKEAQERMSAMECKNHPFIACYRPRDTIAELICRTKAMVLELDNFQYKKMRKLMYLDEAEGRDGECNGMGGHEDNDDHSGDMLSADKGGDSTSSRSASLKSLTSFRSMQSSGGASGIAHSSGSTRRPPIPSSMRSDLQTSTSSGVSSGGSTLIPIGNDRNENENHRVSGTSSRETRPTSPTPPIAAENHSRRNIDEEVATLRKSKFATLRSAKLISREQEEYSKENNMYEQMSGYKRLRQQHHKELQQLEERAKMDKDLLRSREEKELEQLSITYGKERQRLRAAHQSETEKKKKEVEEGEKKLRKQVQTRQQQELRAYAAQQLKEYKHQKEIAKAQLKERGLSRSQTETSIKEIKAQLNRHKSHNEAAFEAKLRNEMDTEELNIQERQMENKQDLIVKHFEANTSMEAAQLREIHALKKKHQETQHEAESTNQNDYNKRMIDELRRKHALQSRQQPKELKLKEQQIRKQYRQAVKIQTRQFKLWQTQMLQAAPRDEQREIEKKLKEEQKRKIALLASQYESQIENMVQEKTVKLESWQEDEARQLNERLAKELDGLVDCQKRQRANLEAAIARERQQLSDSIAKRRAILDQQITDERTEMQSLRDMRRKVMTDRHEKVCNSRMENLKIYLTRFY
ncbi:hypothetical protein WR25_07685 isoform A [Diploscapter pachys]|uniref:non-specific serine/threonine protein kinase n=2 Tax=Diploscapter pachys TaxID=2018661 RepID=A0A2A2JPQ0_9BILA|nr:hypothetical protein WR25_07685 isoform A [Diploscapter pachys]